MKDRLHNTTMWAIVLEALRDDVVRKRLRLDATRLEILKRSRYVLVTGDIAPEQSDLKGSAPPRPLLRFDASFCDAAFAAVTPEWNPVLAAEIDDGERATAFYRLSALPSYLDKLAEQLDAGQ
ncbi:MAG: hypothetical protein ACTHM1_09135 [Solirubrobacteraceae bacterium]